MVVLVQKDHFLAVTLDKSDFSIENHKVVSPTISGNAGCD